jgi:hypothetical protein
VTASAPARLTVTLRKHVTSFVVGRSQRLVSLGVPAGAKPLRLVLRLSLAGHRSRAVAVTIRR